MAPREILLPVIFRKKLRGQILTIWDEVGSRRVFTDPTQLLEPKSHFEKYLSTQVFLKCQ